jgi:hypothetical protein
MSRLFEGEMRGFLSKSLSSLNANKLNGLLAEVELRKYFEGLGFGNFISQGGWIIRRKEPGAFARDHAVFFPEIIQPDTDYPVGRPLPAPDIRLHTICATFHQTGIHAYSCAPEIPKQGDENSVIWQCVQLGVPAPKGYQPLAAVLPAYLVPRKKRYNFLRGKTNTATIPSIRVAEEFSKENLRVAIQTLSKSEMSDVDGIIWGDQFSYPIEIKEKTAAVDPDMGEFFGLDVGPFVKLAFYAAKRGNLHSLFIVREIEDKITRKLKDWWFITFERLAQFASWNFRSGGPNMMGGASAVIKIPKNEFTRLTKASLAKL